MKLNWNVVLFLLVFGDRALLMSMACHWSALGTVALWGEPLGSFSWAAPVVFMASVLVFSVLFFIVNRDGRVSARIRHGVGGLENQCVPMILAGALSSVGGTVLLFRGEPEAAFWAITLGGSLMICEAIVLISSIVGRNQQPTGEAEQPSE